MADPRLPGGHVYNGMVLPKTVLAETLEKVPSFEFRADDVVVQGYPKSGTTWTEQIVWLILNNVDVETSRKVPNFVRTRYFDIATKAYSAMELVRQDKSPRIIKSHLHYPYFKPAVERLGSEGFKIVVVMRNPKDSLVSLYHMYRMDKLLGSFDKDFGEFLELFKTKSLVYGDYFDHVLSYWREKDNPAIHFVKYEDMIARPKEEISKMAKFLCKDLTESEIEAIYDETTFKSMQANPMTNYESVKTFDMKVSKFMRKGKIGDWKNHFTKEQAQYVDSLCARKLGPVGLEFRDV